MRVRIAPTGRQEDPVGVDRCRVGGVARRRGSHPGCLPRAQRGARAGTGCLALRSEASRLTWEIGGFGGLAPSARKTPFCPLLLTGLGSLAKAAGSRSLAF